MLTLRTKSHLLGLLLAVGVISTLPGLVCAAETRPTLRIAVQSDPTLNVLDPHQEVSNVGQRFMHNLFDSLLTIDYFDNWSIKPGLATSWKRTGPRSLELTLREGVKFHDGTLLDADDVVFSLSPQRLLSEDWPGAGAMGRFWSGIESIKAVDMRVVKITTKELDPLLEYRIAAGGSQIISKAAFESAESIEAWSRAPVGTGPFKVGRYRPDEMIVYEAFDDYWGGRPTVSAVHWVVVPETAARLAGLFAGDYDIVTNVPPDQVGRIEVDPGSKIAGGPIGNLHILIFDTRNPHLKDPRLRKALSLAIDRQLIVDALWGGQTDVPQGYQFEAFGPLYDAGRPNLEYDPARAKALVLESDYDGTAIPFNIVNNYYTTEVPRAEALVDMWQEIGVKVDITIHEDFSNLNGGLRNGSTTIYYPDPVGSICRTWGDGSYWDRQGVMESVPARDSFFRHCNELGATIDSAKRREAFGKVLDFFETEMPSVPLHRNAMFYGVRQGIEWQAVDSPIMELRPFNLSFAKPANSRK